MRSRQEVGTQPSSEVAPDLRLLAAVLGLIFIAVPGVRVISPAVSDALAIGMSLFAVLPIASRWRRFQQLSLSLLAFSAAYLTSAWLTNEMTLQGGRHAFTTFASASVLLLFATYGREMLEYEWFVPIASVLAVAGLVLVNTTDAPKNITGGTILYLAALVALMLIANRPSRAWPYSRLFVIGTAVLAVVFDFRSLFALALVLVLGYFAATRFSRGWFWFAGVAGLTSFISGMAWYFMHVYTNPLAISVSTWITDVSGRRAASGRDWLWPAIVNQVREHRWFGLGAGYLPEDFLPTTLSSHSHFFQTYLQLGLVGLALMVWVLLSAWKILAAAEGRAAQFGAAVFLMFVAHNSTEVLMFQNGLIAGIPAWCVIGLGISLAAVEGRSHGPPTEPAQASRVDVGAEQRRERVVHRARAQYGMNL